MGISNEIKVPMIAVNETTILNRFDNIRCVMTAKKSVKEGAAHSEF